MTLDEVLVNIWVAKKHNEPKNMLHHTNIVEYDGVFVSIDDTNKEEYGPGIEEFSNEPLSSFSSVAKAIVNGLCDMYKLKDMSQIKKSDLKIRIDSDYKKAGIVSTGELSNKGDIAYIHRNLNEEEIFEIIKEVAKKLKPYM